jgi:DNA-binding transcriptional LysR family regulator
MDELCLPISYRYIREPIIQIAMSQTIVLPNLRHLKAFQAVAHLKSVSRASVAINLSQPAVTQIIANLDAYFGTPLFDRRYNGSYLTEFGEILLIRTRRMFASIESALGALLSGPQQENSDIASLAVRITVTQIRSLIAVSENVSFDQAARSLGVSQPSLQRAARDLEQLLGCPLYRRGARGTTTTQKGDEFGRRLKLAAREIDYARDEISTRKGVVKSLLAIGTLATSGAHLLSRAVNELLNCHPMAQVRIIEKPYEHLLDDLRAGDIDFLFGVLRKPNWATDVIEEELFSDPHLIAVRPGHPLTLKKNISRRDLMEYDWIIPGPSTPRHIAFRLLFPRRDSPPTTNIETTSRGILRAILTTSNRITLLTRHEAQFEENLGVLSILPFAAKLPPRQYGVATRLDWQPTALQLEFLKLLSTLSRRAEGIEKPVTNRRPRHELMSLS